MKVIEQTTLGANIEERIDPSWYKKLEDVWNSEWLMHIAWRVAEARKNKVVYPDKEDILNAYTMPYDKVRCVIIGQDPYPNENANGYAFSCAKKLSPSLKRILQAVAKDSGVPVDTLDYTLKNWIDQGVMLLNSVLTVEAGKPNSHATYGWQKVIYETLDRLPNNVPVMLWGANANGFRKYINGPVVSAEHPVAGVYRGNEPWNHEDCFNKVNEINETPIDW